MVGMLLIRREAGVLTVSEDGLGKRTPASEFPLQKRGGQGTLVGSGGWRTPIVAALEVTEGDEVMAISAGGAVTRVPASDIPLQGRRTTGKRVVAVKKGDRIVKVTRSAGARAARKGPSGGDPSVGGADEGGMPGASSPPDQGGGEGDEGQLDLLGE